MGKESILLSISMLISGKEDMQKCLQSLQAFRQNMPCELILVDTGCNKEQRKLAEQYADKILEFQWCNDFAAARNVGLQVSSGEWFMYLDDDEWFDNPTEIIQFFLSGEYKKYNCASYVVRNYSNIQGTMYEDSFPSRMVKREKETKFEGKIHEYLTPFKLPKKEFSAFVHHYGYVYKSVEDKKKHAYRNILPLQDLRKEHPGDPRWICQLAQEYFAIQEYSQVIEVCENGLKEWNALKEYIEYGPSHVGAIYAYILISLECLENYEEEKGWLAKAFQEPLMKMKIMEPTVAFYCLVAARLYSHIKNYSECSQYLSEYLDYAERLQNNRNAIEVGTATIVSGVFQESLKYGVILMCLGSAIRAQNFALAHKAFDEMDWNDSRLLKQLEWERDILDACCSVEYNSTMTYILQTLVSRRDGMKEMYVLFLETQISYKKNAESNKLMRLYRLISEINYEHRYILAVKVLWAVYQPDLEVEEKRKHAVVLLTELLQKYGDEFLEINIEVWDALESIDIFIEDYLLEMDYLTWTKAFRKWMKESDVHEIKKWDARLEKWKKKTTIRYKYFIIKCLEGYLHCCQANNVSIVDMEMIMWQCSDAILDLYRPCYNESAFTQSPELLPDEIQFALQLQALHQAREQGSDRDVLEALWALNDTYEPMNGVVAYYAKLYREEVHNRNDEMAKLAVGLKKNVRILINAGNLDDAKNVITQLEQFIPGDEELQAFKEELQMN